MTYVKPIYKKLLIAAIVIYIVGVTAILVNLSVSVEQIKHSLLHVSGADVHNY
jgi:hypothetical protein